MTGIAGRRLKVAGLWVVAAGVVALLVWVCVLVLSAVGSSMRDVIDRAEALPARSRLLADLQREVASLPGVERSDQYDIRPNEVFGRLNLVAYVDFTREVSEAQVGATIKQIIEDTDRDSPNAWVYVVARFGGNELGLAESTALNQIRLDFIAAVSTQTGIQSVSVQRLQSGDNAVSDTSNDGLSIEVRISAAGFDRSLFDEQVELILPGSSVHISP